MDYIIETDFQGPGFVAVPNHVAQRAGLAPEALGLLVYLASQPRGFIVRWSAICAHFGMGKDRWQRIARDLRDIGAMRVENVRGAGGRVIGRRVLVRWPDPVAAVPVSTESRESPLSDQKPGFPAAGKSAKSSGKIRQSEPENPALYKEEKIRPSRSVVRTGFSSSADPLLPCEGQAVQPPASVGSASEKRAALALSLGLPYLDPVSGEWVRPASQAAEKKGACHVG